jgi:hypothetical protein
MRHSCKGFKRLFLIDRAPLWLLAAAVEKRENNQPYEPKADRQHDAYEHACR